MSWNEWTEKDVSREIQTELNDLITGLWPLRNDYFGARLTLRSLVRLAQHVRKYERS